MTTTAGRRLALAGLAVTLLAAGAAWWVLRDAGGRGDDIRGTPARVTAPDARADAPAPEPPVATGPREDATSSHSTPDTPPPAAPTAPVARLHAPGDALEVRVRAVGGAHAPRPLAGATVSVTSRDARAASAAASGAPATPAPSAVRRATDGGGRCTLPLDVLAGASLDVRHPACFPASVPAGRVADAVRAGSPLVVELLPAYPLAGRVGAWGPDAVPAGLAVLAWRGPAPPTREEVVALLEEERREGERGAERAAREDAPAERRLLFTRTVFGGAFRFPARVPPGTWHLTATGQGLATMRPAVVRPEVRGTVQLRAWSAHTLAVQVTDHLGAPLEDVPGATDHLTRWPAEGTLDPMPFTPVERLLLGVEVPPHLEGVRLVDARQPERAATAAPLRIGVKHPGFDTLWREVAIPSTRDGLLVETLALTPNGERLGDLTVVILGWNERTAGLAEFPSASLDLHTEDGRREHVYLTDWVGDRVHLRGLQQGTYTRAHLGIHGMLGEPDIPLPIEISDVPATVVIDPSAFGVLDIDVRDARGRSVDGRLNVFLEFTERPGTGTTAGWHRAPYRVPFLAAYRWTVRVEYAEALGVRPPGYDWPEIDPEPGARVRAVVAPAR